MKKNKEEEIKRLEDQLAIFYKMGYSRDEVAILQTVDDNGNCVEENVVPKSCLRENNNI